MEKRKTDIAKAKGEERARDIERHDQTKKPKPIQLAKTKATAKIHM